jgi:Flp pilus assembly protein TadG
MAGSVVDAVRRRLGRSDRGASAVEMAVLMPVFMFLILVLVQAGLYYHARNVADAVAQSAARQVRSYPGEAGTVVRDVPGNGEIKSRAVEEAQNAWVALDNGNALGQPTVTEADVNGVEQLTLVVRGNARNLLPGLFPQLQVEARAGGPIEVFKDQGDN